LPEKTRTELIAENDCLRARLKVLEARLLKRSLGRSPWLTSGKSKFKQPLHALRDSESRYRRLFETAKDGILILDASTGQITDVNPFLIELLGYSRGEFLGKMLWEIGPFTDVASSQAAFKELQKKQYIRYEELPLETKRGGRVEVEFVSNVYRVNGKNVIQCNIRDISERVQTKAKIRQVNSELSALVDELQKHDHEMRLVIAMNDMLQTCRTLEEAYRVIALASGELFAGQNGGLSILNASGQYLERVAQWGNLPLVDSIFSLDDCWAMRRGQIHEVADPLTGILCHHFVRPPETGYLCLPLVIQGETLGLFCLESPAKTNAEYATNRNQLALTVCEGIKLSLSNIKLREVLREQATQDPLTGLYNRRYLADTLPRELHRAIRNKLPISIAMLDIDHFKHFNDKYGHEAGDLLLRELGHLLRENLRQSDIVSRFGGEEFVLVLPDAPLDASLGHLEKIRSDVKALRIHYRDKMIGQISLSIGVAQSPEHGETGDDILRAADEAMYAAKAAGRDCIVVYHDQIHQEG